MTYTEYSNCLGDLKEIVGKYKNVIKDRVTLLNGTLGAGKTTFVKYYVESQGADITASSPTFTIMQQYKTLTSPVYHFDLYRINSINELEMTGFFEYIEYDGTIFIEWGEKFDIGNFLDNFIAIDIKRMDNGSREYKLVLSLPHEICFNISSGC